MDNIKIKISYRRDARTVKFQLLYIEPHDYTLVVTGTDYHEQPQRQFTGWHFMRQLEAGFEWGEEHTQMTPFLCEVAAAVAKFNGRKNVCSVVGNEGVIY